MSYTRVRVPSSWNDFACLVFAGHHRRRIGQCTSTYYPSPGLAPTLKRWSCLVRTPSITTCRECLAAGFRQCSNRRFGSDLIPLISSVFFHRICNQFNRARYRTIRLYSSEWINFLSGQVSRPRKPVVVSTRPIAGRNSGIRRSFRSYLFCIFVLKIRTRSRSSFETSVLDQQHCRQSCVAMVSRVVRDSEREAVKWIECECNGEKTSRDIHTRSCC